jgi:hypothetical protein
VVRERGQEGLEGGVCEIRERELLTEITEKPSIMALSFYWLHLNLNQVFTYQNHKERRKTVHPNFASTIKSNSSPVT